MADWGLSQAMACEIRRKDFGRALATVGFASTTSTARNSALSTATADYTNRVKHVGSEVTPLKRGSRVAAIWRWTCCVRSPATRLRQSMTRDSCATRRRVSKPCQLDQQRRRLRSAGDSVRVRRSEYLRCWRLRSAPILGAGLSRAQRGVAERAFVELQTLRRSPSSASKVARHQKAEQILRAVARGRARHWCKSVTAQRLSAKHKAEQVKHYDKDAHRIRSLAKTGERRKCRLT